VIFFFFANNIIIITLLRQLSILHDHYSPTQSGSVEYRRDTFWQSHTRWLARSPEETENDDVRPLIIRARNNNMIDIIRDGRTGFIVHVYTHIEKLWFFDWKAGRTWPDSARAGVYPAMESQKTTPDCWLFREWQITGNGMENNQTVWKQKIIIIEYRVKEERKPLYYPYFVCYSAAPANTTSFPLDDDWGNKANECDWIFSNETHILLTFCYYRL